MIKISIAFYIIGLFIFYTWGQFNEAWKESYYFWDKAKDLLLFIGLYLLIDDKNRWVLIPIISFSSIRLLWQILSTWKGWDINNVRAIGILFVILALISCLITVKGLLKWHKQKSYGS